MLAILYIYLSIYLACVRAYSCADCFFFSFIGFSLMQIYVYLLLFCLSKSLDLLLLQCDYCVLVVSCVCVCLHRFLLGGFIQSIQSIHSFICSFGRASKKEDWNAIVRKNTIVRDPIGSTRNSLTRRDRRSLRRRILEVANEGLEMNTQRIVGRWFVRVCFMTSRLLSISCSVEYM